MEGIHQNGNGQHLQRQGNSLPPGNRRMEQQGRQHDDEERRTGKDDAGVACPQSG